MGKSHGDKKKEMESKRGDSEMTITEGVVVMITIEYRVKVRREIIRIHRCR